MERRMTDVKNYMKDLEDMGEREDTIVGEKANHNVIQHRK